MHFVLIWAVALGAFAASVVLTRVVLRYAAARLVDVPNERSSHARATPRGGGIAIVIAFLAGLAVLAAGGAVPTRLALALGPGALAVAAIGWIDDHVSIRPLWRSLVHVGAAVWALWVLGGLPVLRVGVADVPLGPFGAVLGVLGIVWVTNLYNFMDGIDGIAAGEAVTVGLAGAALLALAHAPGLAAASLLLACASAGFLLWNWHPARIFMGDVASGTLGYLFAVLAVASENARAVPLLGWVMLLGVFVLDATVTLARRFARRQRLHEAHRSHAYQRAVQAGLSHARVSGAVVALNAGLAVLAAVAAVRPEWLLAAFAASAAWLGWVYARVERLCPMR